MRAPVAMRRANLSGCALGTLTQHDVHHAMPPTSSEIAATDRAGPWRACSACGGRIEIEAMLADLEVGALVVRD